eukprot:scaffold2252_cov150-Amphora_coffeaeformis.AAC.6
MLSKGPFIEGVPMIPMTGSKLFGHLAMMREPDFQVSLYNFSVKYADENGRCTFYMGPTVPALSVTMADDVQTLLKASSHREVFPLMQPHVERFMGKHNIGVLTGKEWKNKRAVIVKALHGKSFHEHNVMAVKLVTEKLRERLATEESTEDISKVMCYLTVDIFGQSALHTNFGCCESLRPSRIMESFDFLASEMMRRIGRDILNPASHMYSLPTEANKRHAEERAYIRDYIANLVQERRKLMKHEPNKVPIDLLTSLLENTEHDADTTLSEDVLSDILISLLFAGFETTSVTLTYVFYLLSQHADVERKCLDEIAADPEQFYYLGAVIKETMRLYPPAISTTRSLEREMVIGDGILVPKGTYLYFPIWVIQRDARNFPDPLEFRPERWVEQKHDGKWCERIFSGSGDDAANPGAFVAFSAGARSCAGQRFAMEQMTLVLSILLPSFHFEPPSTYVLEPHRDGFVQCPKGGIPMKITKRM